VEKEALVDWCATVLKEYKLIFHDLVRCTFSLKWP
jgi:hypothetical protein